MKLLKKAFVLTGCVMAAATILAACSSDSGDGGHSSPPAENPSNQDEPPAPANPSDWTTSSDGKTLTYTGTKAAKNVTIPAFDIDPENGFTIKFKATFEAGAEFPYDWEARVLSYKSSHVTIPNLDARESDIPGVAGRVAYPFYEDTNFWQPLSNGLTYNSAFDGKAHEIEIAVSRSNCLITYYLDGKTWVTYNRSSLFDNNTEEGSPDKWWNGILWDFIDAYTTGLKDGKVVLNKGNLDITDITISKGARADEVWTLSSDGSTLKYTGIIRPVDVQVPAFNVTSEEGFTLEFTATLPVYQNGFDWGSKILQYMGCNVTIPNLDPWNNFIYGSSLTELHSVPTAAGAQLANNKTFDAAFDGNSHTIKITFASDTIKYYLDNEEWVTYSSNTVFQGDYDESGPNRTVEGKLSEFIGYYIQGLNAGAVWFNCIEFWQQIDGPVTNITISKGIK